MSKLGNKPAYPRPFSESHLTNIEAQGGCTKRELFAAMAMQGMLKGKYEDAYVDIAVFACDAADALLAELAEENDDE